MWLGSAFFKYLDISSIHDCRQFHYCYYKCEQFEKKRASPNAWVQCASLTKLLVGVCSNANTQSRKVLLLTTQQYTVVTKLHSKVSLLLQSIHVLQMMYCQHMLPDAVQTTSKPNGHTRCKARQHHLSANLKPQMDQLHHRQGGCNEQSLS